MNAAEILQELRELRRENQELFTDTNASLSRLEAPVTDLKQRMWKLEQRAGEADSRTSAELKISDRWDGRRPSPADVMIYREGYAALI